MLLLAHILLATAITQPIYVEHNKVTGKTQVMTNMVSWATSVTNAIANASSTPSAPVTDTAISYHADHTAVSVTVGATGTLTADTTNWVAGQTQTAIITLTAGASVSSAIVLVGYTSWITDQQFIAECVYLENKVYVSPVVCVQ